MSYIAFVGYSEQDFKNFKIGNKSVQICNKSEYPDPTDYILQNSNKLGATGESCVENILTKLNKNERFKNFSLINSSKQPHCGDLLFINQVINICFMIECKNKKHISYKEDLNKFDSDINNVAKLYKCKVIGVFLQLYNDKITNHDNIELNDNTIYLTKSYINLSCLELLFIHYIKMNTIETYNINKNDNEFIKLIINDLKAIKDIQNKEATKLYKVINHNERDINMLKDSLNCINSEIDLINAIINKYNNYSINNSRANDSEEFEYEEDESEPEETRNNKTTKITAKETKDNKKETKQKLNKNYEDENDIINDDDIFADIGVLDSKKEAQSCYMNNKIMQSNLFKQMKEHKITPSNITKKDLLIRYPKYESIIRNTTISKMQNDYKAFLMKR